MQDGFVRIAALSPEIRVADTAFNAQSVITAALEAEQAGARLVVFPELCLTGATAGDLFRQSSLLNGALAALEAVLAAQKTDAVWVVGLPFRWKNCLFDVAAVLQGGNILGLVPSEAADTRAFASAPWDDEEVCVLGQETLLSRDLVFRCTAMDDFSFGVVVGETAFLPDGNETALALAGANCILNPTAFPALAGGREARRNQLIALSRKLCAGYVSVSAGEGESTQDAVMAGGAIFLENGDVLFESKPFDSEPLYGEIDFSFLAGERRRKPAFRQAVSACFVDFDMEVLPCPVARYVESRPFVPKNADMTARAEEILNIQVRGLLKRLRHTGAKKCVLGVSGGLDSTLALIVTARAIALAGLPADSLVAVTMPCFGTTSRTRSNAEVLSCALGADFVEIRIEKAVTQHLEDIGLPLTDRSAAYENAQARERTQVLMDLANKVGGLVIGTGDLSELALGWATYNGDHMSMYGVNASVPKTLLRHIVRYVADTAENEDLRRALLDVLDTPVSPELLPPEDGKIAQKTEDLVGPYDLHDFFLYRLVRRGETPEKILRMAEVAFKGEFDNATVEKWLSVFTRRFFSQQFKRSCLPDGPKVGTVSLSPRGDFMMPSDASGTNWRI